MRRGVVTPAPAPSGPVDRRVIAELPSLRRVLAASVGLGAVATASVVVQAIFVARLLASAMPGAPALDRRETFEWLAAAIVVRATVALVNEPLSRAGAATAKAELRRRLLAAVTRRASSPAGRSPAEVATLAGHGLDALDAYLGHCLPDLFVAAVAPAITLVAIGVLDWLSALILLVAIGLFPVFGALVGKASTSLARARWHEVESLGRQVVDTFEGLAVLRAFGRSADQRARVARADEALREASMSTLRVAFLSALVLDTLASVSVALVAVPLGLRLLDGSIRLSAALAVLIIAPEVLLPLRRASAEFHESTEGLAAAGEAMSAIAGGVERGESARTTPLPRCPAPDPAVVPVVLESVTVATSLRQRPILDAVDLTIAPGETVALIGPNGAGKSTILALVLGFLLPSNGAVRIGGRDLADVDLDEWRTRITYLSSYPALVADTLAANLRIAHPAASDEELRDALTAAGAGGLLHALPEGLETRLGEGGRPVSAGERQRIALARTLLRPASLYLLDEPTVHLDSDCEAAAIDSLAIALAGKSALIVTHRRRVLAIADRVIRLDDGRTDAVAPPWHGAPLTLAGNAS